MALGSRILERARVHIGGGHSGGPVVAMGHLPNRQEVDVRDRHLRTRLLSLDSSLCLCMRAFTRAGARADHPAGARGRVPPGGGRACVGALPGVRHVRPRLVDRVPAALEVRSALIHSR